MCSLSLFTGVEMQHVLFPPIYNNSKLCLVLQFIIIVNYRTKIAPQHLDTDERDKKICINGPVGQGLILFFV